MWIPITIAAATFQILRTSRQHGLRDALGTNAAGFVRYLYGAPLALLACVATFALASRPLPSIPLRFVPIIAAGGVAQILGTVALLRSFKLRDFALGTVYSKTEVIQVAVIGAIALGEPLAPLGWFGAVVVMVSVALLAGHGSLGTILRRAGDPAALMGIAAGGLFGAAAVAIRGASGTLDGGTAWDRALVTLTVMLAIQTVLNGTHLALTDRAELRATVVAWRAALPVGVLSLAGSAGWALAVTLENAAKVRTLGQVELLLAFGIARWQLGERHTRAQVFAGLAVGVGIAIVTLFG